MKTSEGLQRSAKYAAARKRRKKWRTAVTCMAAVVMFCTVYALILPAITLELSTLQEIHTHDESCYDETGSLVCGYEDAAAGLSAANMTLYSARLGGTIEGISWSLTPAAGGGYRLLLDAQSAAQIPSGLFSDETLLNYKDGITAVSIGAGITEIQANAFSAAFALQTVTFAEESALRAIGAGAFAGCEQLTSVNLESCRQLELIGSACDAALDGAFYNTGLTQITIPSGVRDIADFAFYGCKSLTNVYFEENTVLTNMGAYVFANCSALDGINLDGLKGNALTFGTKESVTIGEEMIENGNGLFYGCTALKSLTLPNMSGSIAYLCKGCSALSSLSLDACTKLVCNDTTESTQLRKFIDGCTALTMLDMSKMTGVTVLCQGIVGGESGEGAADNAVSSGVKTLILPHTVTQIAHYAASYSGVEEIVFTKGEDGRSHLTAVGGSDYNNNSHNHALSAASKLKEVDLQFDSTAAQTGLYLQSYAFENCSALERLTVSSENGLAVFGTPSFLYGCGRLQELVWDVKSVTTTLNWWGAVNEYTSKNICFTIGPHTEVLPGYLLSSLQGNISEYSFTPGHSFYVEGYYDWSTTPGTYYGNFDAPFTEAGCYYADADGNLYRLYMGSDGANTAELVYANKSGSGTYTVPATLLAWPCTASGRSDTEAAFTVTGVNSNAFMDTAYDSILFDMPANITKLMDNAFDGAFNLTSINGKTTEQEIKELFTGASFGHDLFLGTKITSLPFADTTATPVYPGSGAISVTNEKLVQLSVASSSKLTALQAQKCFATGETATVTIGVSEHTTDKKTRLYVKVSDHAHLTLPEKIGSATRQSAAEGSVYYYDLQYDQAQTYDFGIACAPYVAPNKKAYVWLMEADNAAALEQIGNAVIEPGKSYPADGAATAKAGSQYIEITWNVLPEEYSVENKPNEALAPAVKKTAGAADASTVVDLSFTVSNKLSSRETDDGKAYNTYGADYVEYVDFEDELTLPQGLKWKDGLLERAVFAAEINTDNNGGQISATIDGNTYTLCTLNLATGKLVDISCAVADKNLIIKWRTENRDKTTEISPAITTLTYGPEVIEVDGAVTAEVTYEVKNTVSAAPTYTYSGTVLPVTKTASSSFTSTPSPLAASKVWVKQPTYMGEEAVYNITLDHVADANSIGVVDIYDDLDIHQRLKADTMEQMLLGSAHDGDYLTITISNAVLMPVPESKEVTAVDGTTKKQTSVSDTAKYPVYDELAMTYEASTGTTITIKKEGTDSDAYINVTVVKTDGESITYTVGSGKQYADLQTALDALGYVASIRGSCVLHWQFPQGSVSEADSHKEYELHTFVKNSLEVMTEDHNTSIVADVAEGSHNYPVSNKLYISQADYENKNTENAIVTALVYPTYDLSLDKIATVDGSETDTDKIAEIMETRLATDESFLIDYRLNIKHLGSGTYGLLPVVDHMTGVQALLADVTDNAGAEWITAYNPEIYENPATGSRYYVLNADNAVDGEAVYQGVWLENGYADSVTVKKNTDGLDTLIKWYYVAEAKNSYTLSPSYQAVCSLSLAGTTDSGLHHFVNNEAWVNDLPTRRLHDTIGAEGSSIAFQKHIVTNQGKTPDADTLWEDSTSPFLIEEAGTTITYRLDFENTGRRAVSLAGTDFYDILPAVGVDENGNDIFSWSTENASVTYWKSDERITISDESPLGYSIVDDGKGSYRLKWTDDFSIDFPENYNGKVCIYVTLTFPTGDAWEQYVAAKHNAMLYNSLYVHGVASRVIHALPNPGEAMLRKGVYETGYYVIGNNVTTTSEEYRQTYHYFRGTDRSHYVKTASDAQIVKNTVTYFVTLYNSSKTANLHLSPIYDQLPEGFQFYAMVATPDSTDSTVGYSGNIHLWDKNWSRTADSVGLTAYSYEPLAKPASAAALLTWYGGTDNTVRVRTPYNSRMLTFDVTLDDAHRDELGYYLMPGEAIQFGYMCFTGDADVSDAANYCGMEYLDYSCSGVALTAEANQMVTVANTAFTASANTGEAQLITSAQAARLGFTQTSPNNPVSDSQWLVSGVSLTEGSVVPGITKQVDSYNVERGEPVGWTVTATNSGTDALRDYTVTDTIQSPFSFSGSVGYAIRSRVKNAYSYEAGDSDNREVVKAGIAEWNDLFQITEMTADGVTLASKDTSDVVTATTAKYGEEKALTVSTRFLNSVTAGGSYADAGISVCFIQNAGSDGNVESVTMRIRFIGGAFSIPPDGESVLTVKTLAPDIESTTNGVYVNNASIIPTQPFDEDSVTQGKVSGNSVSSAASVNIYTGILTTAYKTVFGSGQTGISPNYEGNDASLSVLSDRILLGSTDRELTYTLYVDGADDNNMQKLVVIDTLPQTGDTNPINDTLQRGSQFQVDFAEEPEVTVQIETKDSTTGNVTSTDALTSGSDYTVQYSDKINGFGKSTDWEAEKEDAAVWHEEALFDAAADRSIRIVLNRALAKNQTVKISFHAVVSQTAAGDNALPGETAWNNFGYSFLTNSGMWLYAAPQKVGVTLQSAPVLTKKLVNSEGTAVSAAEDTGFDFIIYEGTGVNFEGDYSAAAVGTALTKENRSFTHISADETAVKKGASSSDKLLLNPATTKKCTYDNNVFTRGTESWIWTDGRQYTVVELEGGGTANEYAFDYVNDIGNRSRAYTFTYDQTKNQAITVYNTRHDWRISITKTNDASPAKALSGAVFGLYSVNENPDIAEQLFEFGLPENTDTSITYASASDDGATGGGETYYLSQLAKTDTDGKLIWEPLCEDQYIVKELKPPDGYIPSADALRFTYTDARVSGQNSYSLSQTVVNKIGYEMPQTGGPGTALHTAGGLAAVIGAGLCLFYQMKKKKGR